MKHTPGPWRIEQEPSIHVRSDAGCVLASDYTTPANARLIAAAPELLDALKEASDHLAELYAKYQVKIGPFASQSQRINVIARAAIAKATGSEA